MTPRKLRYTGRFGHVNSSLTINIHVLNLENFDIPKTPQNIEKNRKRNFIIKFSSFLFFRLFRNLLLHDSMLIVGKLLTWLKAFVHRCLRIAMLKG